MKNEQPDTSPAAEINENTEVTANGTETTEAVKTENGGTADTGAVSEPAEWGKELHDYLQDYKKKTYKEWTSSEELYRYLMSEGQRLEEMAVELIQDGLAEDQMREIVRAEIYGDLTE